MTHHKRWPEHRGSKPDVEEPGQVLGSHSHGEICASRGMGFFPQIYSFGSSEGLSDSLDVGGGGTPLASWIMEHGWDRKILLETRRGEPGGGPGALLPWLPHTAAPACSIQGTVSEMRVLLGHVAVAPRGPPACGCVHSGELVGKQSVP
jgi:hypothetical protein